MLDLRGERGFEEVGFVTLRIGGEESIVERS